MKTLHIGETNACISSFDHDYFQEIQEHATVNTR